MAGTFSAASFRTLGTAATPHNLLTIENIDATKLVTIRRITVQLDATAVLTAVMPQVKISRGTSISGGVLLDKAKFLTTQTSDAFVRIRSAMGEGAAITATPGDTIWQQFAGRLHTTVEQVIGSDENLAPMLVEKNFNLKIRPGQSLLTTVVAAAGTSNAALTNSWLINCAWEEEEIVTFAISGTVTLSGSPVSGARVIVMESDDLAGTNMFLRETIVTGAGGTWASSILTGKVGAAFVQYETGGTLYTAPGSPYLE